MRPGRALFLYFRFLAQNIKVRMEYKADFLILLFAGAAFQVLGFLFLNVLFTKIPSILGWTMWEIIMMLAAIYFTEGVVSFAFEGVWNCAFLINSGELDRMLLRPVSPILQVIGSNMGVHGIGNIASGVILFALSLANLHVVWTPERVLFMPVYIVSAAAIRTAISFASNATSFWFKAYSNAFPLMVLQLADFAKYPTTVFAAPLRILVTYVLPYAFISYIPTSYILGKDDWAWTAWLLPLVAAWCVFAARGVFYRGLSSYESAGN